MSSAANLIGTMIAICLAPLSRVLKVKMLTQVNSFFMLLLLTADFSSSKLAFFQSFFQEHYQLRVQYGLDPVQDRRK